MSRDGKLNAGRVAGIGAGIPLRHPLLLSASAPISRTYTTPPFPTCSSKRVFSQGVANEASFDDQLQNRACAFIFCKRLRTQFAVTARFPFRWACLTETYDIVVIGLRRVDSAGNHVGRAEAAVHCQQARRLLQPVLFPHSFNAQEQHRSSCNPEYDGLRHSLSCFVDGTNPL